MSFTPPVQLYSVQLDIRRVRQAGLTLVEVLASISLLTLIVTTSIWALAQANNSAASNRIYTCAETIAQNQIDAFLSAEPYSPRHIADDGTAYPRSPTALIPTILATGTTTTNPTIYTDPSGTLTVTGTMTCVVTDLGLNQTTNGQTDSLDYRSLSVTLNYTFKGNAYTVALSTVRTSDFER